MKNTTIQDAPPRQTRGAEKSIEKHISNLRVEFSGQSELLFYHAKLIVLIRRGHAVGTTYKEFKKLWNEEAEFLRTSLNLRWLISAADTFCDHDPDPSVRSIALAASVMANTTKIYESERYLTDNASIRILPQKADEVKKQLVPLFDGMSCFTVGTDDTLRNMAWRIKALSKTKPVGLILGAIWDRHQSENTAFGRFRRVHERKSTEWWD